MARGGDRWSGGGWARGAATTTVGRRPRVNRIQSWSSVWTPCSPASAGPSPSPSQVCRLSAHSSASPYVLSILTLNYGLFPIFKLFYGLFFSEILTWPIHAMSDDFLTALIDCEI